MVGGRDKTGALVSNDLTRMLIKAIEQVNLVYPSVGLCCCKDTPEEDMNLATEILGKGHSHPAFFNDEVISKGLRFHGMGADEACDYIHSTCVEITPAASSNVWVASPYTNLTQKLLDVLDRDYNSADEILAAFFGGLEESIRANMINEIRWRVERARYAMDPLLSCFVNDCIEKGRDIEQGGARYNWIMPSFVGLSNVADALLVMEKLIFEKKELSLAELRAALAANFEGYEPLRQRILNAVPKYGNDNDEADKYVIKITGWLTKEMEKYQPRGETYLIPSLFCWIMHDRFGQATGASPDGRKAGFPLGDGSGPAQGREMAGPTAAILSSTKWDHHRFIGGIAVNMKFSKRLFSRESAGKLKALVRTYLDRGGFETQINVVDKDVLVKAKANPDAYRDLVVRIGGYSDYFVKLSPTMQDEVIQRTEFQI
jgi:formate C-acetyltransferase